MTFEEALNAYEKHFDRSYPFAMGVGFPRKTDADNIELIEKAISSNTPVTFDPGYSPDMEY